MQKHLRPVEISSADTVLAPVDALLEHICSRRSTAPKRLVRPGPSRKQVKAMIEVALTAPDHGLLRPWKFLFVSTKQREALGELFAQEKRHYQPGARDEDIEKERGRAFNAPALIAVLLTPYPDHPRVTLEDQYLSLGAAIQNILLSAHALGFGAMMTSGRKINSGILQDAFSPSGAHRLTGFISIGTPSEAPRPRVAPLLGDHFSDWFV